MGIVKRQQFYTKEFLENMLAYKDFKVAEQKVLLTYIRLFKYNKKWRMEERK